MSKEKESKKQDKDEHKDRKGPLSVIADYILILLLGIFALKMLAAWLNANRIVLWVVAGSILTVAVIAKIIINKNHHDRF